MGDCLQGCWQTTEANKLTANIVSAQSQTHNFQLLRYQLISQQETIDVFTHLNQELGCCQRDK